MTTTIGNVFHLSFDQWRRLLDQTYGSSKARKAQIGALSDAELHGLYDKVMRSDATATKTTSGGIPQTADQVLYDNTDAVVSPYLDAKSKASGAPKAAAPPPPTGAAGSSASARDASGTIGAFGAALGLNPDQIAKLQQGFDAYAPDDVNLFPGLGIDLGAKVHGNEPGTRIKFGVNDGLNHVGTFSHLGPEGPDVEKGAGQWLTGLYKLEPEQLSALQLKLWSQGWYKGTDIKDPSQLDFGHPDPATIQAYATVLQEAARYNKAGQPLTIDSVIDMGAPAGLAAGKQQREGRPFSPTSTADLMSAATTAAESAIGRDLSDAEKMHFAQHYIAAETTARRQGIAAADAGNDTAITGPGTPSAEADQYIDKEHLTDKVAYGAAVRQQAFYSLLDNPAGIHDS